MQEKLDFRKYSGWLDLGVSIWFGSVQAGTEALKIYRDGPSPKFPLGWASYNIVEEFSEGSMPALAGAVAMDLAYRVVCNKTNLKYNPTHHANIVVIGSIFGYVSVFYVGRLLHEYYGMPDVKWGPFK